MNTLYHRMSRLRWIRDNYSLKFLSIAFIGIHIPLITIVLFLVTDNLSFSKIAVFWLTLTATLLSTAGTLFFLNRLLWPLHAARIALENYSRRQIVPDLPTSYTDEAGILLKELQATLVHLDQLMEEKRDVTTLLSHDIRAPFQQFLGLADLIRTSQNQDELTRYAEMIRQISLKNLLVLNDILKILHSDKIETKDHSSFILNELIDECSISIATHLAGKSVSLNQTAKDTIRVNGNRVLLKEAIMNLLDNAIKFSHTGGRIDLDMERDESNARISIRDYGMGFPPEDSERIFDRFTRAGQKGTKGEPSSGVGLYLARKITRQHGGDITASSAGNAQGAIFKLMLPTA
jgi:signal transduction histidine kinase